MEIDKIFEGVKLDDDVREVMTGRLEAFNTELDSTYSKSLAEADGKLKEAIDTRDKAKAKLKELQEKITKGDFEGKKELADLNAQLQTEKDTLEESLKSLDEKYKTIETKYKGYIETSKKEWLEKLPEGDLRKTGESMDLDQLKTFVKGLAKHNITKDDSTSVVPKDGKPKQFKDIHEWREHAYKH